MNTFSPLAAIYSADAKLSLTDLKKGNYDQAFDTSKILAYAQDHQIFALTQQDNSYPKRLKNQTSSPFLFYYQGDISLLERPILGIVGPRNPSDYAGQVMNSLFLQLYKYDLVTISGFAKGIDQQAHQLSLKYQIPTILVLGGGFHHYLRSKDRELLAEVVANGGLVISPFKIGFEPTKRSFPARNKLLAQLCDILFLPEAQEKSWSLITAEFAFQMKKPVYSVPAPIFAQSSAGIFSKMEEKKLTLISDFSAFLSQYFHLIWSDENAAALASLAPTEAPPALHLSQKQSAIYSALQSQGEGSLDALLAIVGMDYGALMHELTLMEMEGIIIQSRPGYYAIA